MKFVDEVEIEVKAGKGGNGIASFRREKYIEFGGPDGGDGGDGGNIYLKGTKGLNTLADFRTKKKFDAQNGENGMSKNKTGRKGDDLDILVPLGTIVCNSDNGVLISELVEDGQKLLVAKGGKHGFGNLRFKSSTNRAPRKFTKGSEGEELILKLELRLLADAGFLGKPNAGKSSLLRAMTKAKPKVADYPFTTINPSLGVVEIGFGESYVVADIPGLIEGAADGIGLGTQFLKHLSRTNILLHVVDIQHIQENQINIDLIEINHELEKFDKNLINKKQYIIFNKIDLLSKNDLDCIKEKVYKIYEKEDVFFTSTVNNIGINELKNYISRKLKDL
jgi:GTP-binding protein|tara:strand:+ start:1808 stop:2812 length:1005 start_codon:yes stop_codon:yes gene_type:complete